MLRTDKEFKGVRKKDAKGYVLHTILLLLKNGERHQDEKKRDARYTEKMYRILSRK